MNAHFSFRRFYKYVKYDFYINKNKAINLIAGLIAFMFIILFPIYSMFGNSSIVIYRSFVVHLLILLIIITGFSFSSLSSKNSAINNLMLPVSSFEKLIHFFIFRYGLIIFLFPIIYYLFYTLHLLSIKNILHLLPERFSSKNLFVLLSPIEVYHDFVKVTFPEDKQLADSNRSIIIGYFFTFTISSLLPFKFKFKNYWLLVWFLAISLLFLIITVFLEFSSYLDRPPFGYVFPALPRIIVGMNIFLFWVLTYFLLKEKEI